MINPETTANSPILACGLISDKIIITDPTKNKIRICCYNEPLELNPLNQPLLPANAKPAETRGNWQSTLGLTFRRSSHHLNHSFRQAHESCFTSSSGKSCRTVAGTGLWNPGTGWCSDLVLAVKKPSGCPKQKNLEQFPGSAHRPVCRQQQLRRMPR